MPRSAVTASGAVGLSGCFKCSARSSPRPLCLTQCWVSGWKLPAAHLRVSASHALRSAASIQRKSHPPQRSLSSSLFPYGCFLLCAYTLCLGVHSDFSARTHASLSAAMNAIKNTKYSVLSFLPVVLFKQFRWAER